MSAGVLGAAQLACEKLVLDQFWMEVEMDRGMHCFAVRDTLLAQEMGAVEKLPVCEDLDMTQLVTKNRATGEDSVTFLSGGKIRVKERSDAESVEFQEESSVEWICDNRKTCGCDLELVSDRTS